MFINVTVNRLLDKFSDEIYRVYGNVSRDSSQEWTAGTKATKEVHANACSVRSISVWSVSIIRNCLPEMATLGLYASVAVVASKNFSIFQMFQVYVE